MSEPSAAATRLPDRVLSLVAGLPAAAGAQVALLVRRPRPGVLAALQARFTEVALFDETDLHLRLSAGRPWDLIVDLREDTNLAAVLYHLGKDGWLVTGAAAHRDLLSRVAAARSQGIQPPTPGRDTTPIAARDLAALAYSIAESRSRDDLVALRLGVSTLAKIPEADLDTFLALRPDAGVVLSTVPACEWTIGAQVRGSDQALLATLPTTYAAPSMSLREYRQVTCLQRQAVFGPTFVAPESYRHHFKRRLRNVMFAEWEQSFVRTPEVSATPVTGPLFHVDNYVRGHFGHALTEQVSHLWGWPLAKARYPDLRALVFVNRGRDVAGWEFELLAAAGIDRCDVLVADAPLLIDRLITTSPMFGMPAFVHPGILETYDAMGSAFASMAGPGSRPKRIFCTRRGGKRSCHNTGEVEALFEEAGFTVVLPEEHALSEQVALFRDAEVVAGFAGSGMFQTMFAGRPQQVILVGSESYTATNEYLIAAVWGHRLDLVWCRPDIPKTTRRFDEKSYQSDFTFDPDREGVFLRDVLAGLD